jgi:hypothetical protein
MYALDTPISGLAPAASHANTAINFQAYEGENKSLHLTGRQLLKQVSASSD